MTMMIVRITMMITMMKYDTSLVRFHISQPHLHEPRHLCLDIYHNIVNCGAWWMNDAVRCRLMAVVHHGLTMSSTV